MTSKKTTYEQEFAELKSLLLLDKHANVRTCMKTAIIQIANLKRRIHSLEGEKAEAIEFSEKMRADLVAKIQHNAKVNNMLLDLFILSVGGTPPERD